MPAPKIVLDLFAGPGDAHQELATLRDTLGVPGRTRERCLDGPAPGAGATHPYARAVALRLATFRVASRRDVADLAEDAGYAPITVMYWETGRRNVRLPVLEVLARVYGTTVADLMDVGAPVAPKPRRTPPDAR